MSMSEEKCLPLVSICIPTYNGEKFLLEALESIRFQTYKNIEVVISDDASIDSTLDIVESFSKQTDIPIQVHNHKPQGIGENWNNCVRNANGKYIKFLFQDDVLKSECIEKMVFLAEKNKKIGLVYCKRSVLCDENNELHQQWINRYGILHESWHNMNIANEDIRSGKDYLKDLNLFMFPKNKIGEPTAVLLRKDCFKKAGYFNTDLKQTLDIEYWLRVMKYFKIGFIDEELISFRLHNEQASVINKKEIIPDYDILSRMYYRNLFWYLNPKYQWKLFRKYSWIASVYRKKRD